MKQITDKLIIASQIDPSHMVEARKLGVQAIINNRPDGEEFGQPRNAELAEAARDLGLDFIFLPVSSAGITPRLVEDFQAQMRQSQGPVLAYCRSGTRSLSLWVIGEVMEGRLDLADLKEIERKTGINLDGARAWLKTYQASIKGNKETETVKKPVVQGFFDHRTFSIQYVVADPETKKCAIVDPVLDFDEKSGQTSTENADKILSYISEKGYEVEWILDTHPHADHFSSARYLKEKTGAKTAIGDQVVKVQKLWKGIYNWPDFPADGSQWDKTFAAGETFSVGNIPAFVMFSPGHTLASITYVIGDAAFVHDTLFMPDSGTARADFPGGASKILWNSIQDILALPDETRIFTGHDYQPGGRVPKWESTVAEQKAKNPHIAGVSEEEFIKLRDARDKTLPMPKLILHALQINMNGGRLPEPEANGMRYLKFPLNALEGAAWE